MPKAPRTVSFQCIPVRQGPYDLVTFVAKAKTIWSIVKVNRRESDKDVGYQRTLSTSRVRSLQQYIDAGNFIPNSVLVSFDAGSHLSKDGTKLTVPKKPDAGWVIDGQHRLAGAHESSKNLDIVVVAFIGLPEDEQINQFVVINREAKGVPTSLYYDLLKHLPSTKSDAEVAKERAVDIANALKRNETSPFYQRIVIEPPKRGQLSLTNFVRKVSPLLIDKKGKFHTYTLNEQLTILDNYFQALSHVFSREFDDPKLTFFKTLGFGAVVNSLPTVFDLSLKEYHGFRTEDAVKTLKSVDYFDFSGWEKSGTGTAAELQAGEDFRQEIIKSFGGKSETGSLRLK